MLKKLGLQKYLLLVIFMIILISLLSSLFTIFFTQRQITQLTDSSTKSAAISNNIISLSIDLSTIHSSLSSLITEKDPDVLETSITKVSEGFKTVEEHLKQCQFDCNLTRQLSKDYQLKVNELIEKRILLGKTAEAIEFFIQDLSPVYFKALTELDSKGELIKKQSSETAKTSQSEGDKLKYSIIASSLSMILLITIAGLNFRKVLVHSLVQITNKLNMTTQTLQQTSDEVATTSDFLSEASTEQTATVQGTSQAVQQISSMTEVNRNNVAGSAANARESMGKIVKGKEAIAVMMETIRKINESNQKMVEQVNKNGTEFNEVTDLIKEIDTKTKIINDIVFQTKLLSFNASVEAARAGEHGKGFAVVAEEIGNLAIMSGQAANDISNLLNSSVVRVNDIVNRSQNQMVGIVESGKNSIEDGNQAVNNCHKIFDEISHDSENINTMLEEINAGTTEQSKGIEEVNKSMLQINDVASKNAHVAQDSQKMAEKLKQQSLSIAEITHDLSVMLNGSGT